jgi:hypothetical protein
LHAAQDFYSHTNWADEAGPGPITIENPRGLNRSAMAPFLNLRLPVDTVPQGLISGCFILSPARDGFKGKALCTVTAHEDLNKDTGLIDPDRFGLPGDPTLFSATTPRGKIGRNFHKAVAAAVSDTRDKIRYFRERLIAAYGAEMGALMFCAITNDDPVTTCPVGRPVTGAPPAPSPPDMAPPRPAPRDARPPAPGRAGGPVEFEAPPYYCRKMNGTVLGPRRCSVYVDPMSSACERLQSYAAGRDLLRAAATPAGKTALCGGKSARELLSVSQHLRYQAMSYVSLGLDETQCDPQRRFRQDACNQQAYEAYYRNMCAAHLCAQ